MASESKKYAYPLESGSGWDGGVADHMSRAFGNWYSDNAVDIMCPVHTGVIAVEDGTISSVSDHSDTYDPSANPNGSTLFLTTNSGEFCYMHLINFNVTQGQHVSRGEQIGQSGTANSADHLHFAAKPPLNPEEVVEGAEIGPGGPDDGSGTTGPGTSPFSEGDLFAVGRAAAFSTQMQLEGAMNSAETMMMKGAKSIYNDIPIMTFVQQLCQASLRNFQSLPNGAFFAFFPDQFGLYGHRKPYWAIDDIEIVDGGMELSDESLATHVFVVGDHNFTGDIDLADKVKSDGVVTVFDFFMSGRIIDDDPKTDKEKAKKETKAYKHALQFMRKYGQRPLYEEVPFIRNNFYEIFYAFTQFSLAWANQFRTTFSFTFMPELYPGGRVAFPNHDITCYIDSVTHSFDYEAGFLTQANLSAPSAKENSQVTQGMLAGFGTRAQPKLEFVRTKEKHPND